MENRRGAGDGALRHALRMRVSGNEAPTGPPPAWKGGLMDRKQFLQRICGAGICGCALSFLAAPEALKAEEAAWPVQRLAFARYQLASFMAAGQDATACAGFIQMTGCECAKLGQLPVKFKGNPDGYLAAFRKLWGTESTRDRRTASSSSPYPRASAAARLSTPRARRRSGATARSDTRRSPSRPCSAGRYRWRSRSRSSPAARAASSRSAYKPRARRHPCAFSFLPSGRGRIHPS